MSKKIDGDGLATDKFYDNKEVLLPVLNEKTIEMPKFFIRQIASKKGRKFRLFVPTTKTRNLSTRQKTKSMYVERLDKDEVTIIDNPNYDKLATPPKLSEFSKADQKKLTEFFKDVKEEETKTHPLNERPETGTNPTKKPPKKGRPPTKKRGRPPKEPEKKKRGRPRKADSDEEEEAPQRRRRRPKTQDEEPPPPPEPVEDELTKLQKKYDKINEETEKVRVEMNEKVRHNRYFKESLTKEEYKNENDKAKKLRNDYEKLKEEKDAVKKEIDKLTKQGKKDTDKNYKEELEKTEKEYDEISKEYKKVTKELNNQSGKVVRAGIQLGRDAREKEKEIYDKIAEKFEKLKAENDNLEEKIDNLKKKIRGKGLAAETFNPTNPKTEVLLPVLNDKTLYVPEYFIQQVFSKRLKEGQRKFKLFAPTTSSRNLSTRKGEKSLKVLRVNKDELELKDGNFTPAPNLSEFSKKDREKLIEFFQSVKEPLKEYNLQTKKTPKKKPVKRPTIDAVTIDRPLRETIVNTEEAIPQDIEFDIVDEPNEPAAPTGKKRGRPAKYATKEQAREERLKSQRAASKRTYANLTPERIKQKAIKKGTYNPPTMETQSYEGENDIVEGEGIMKSITKGVNKVVNVVSKKGKEVGKFIEKVINPDAFMPPSVKAIMNNHGQEIITSITLRRNPVSHLITGAMNAVSLGSFQKKLDEQPYDELFHLAMLVQTDKTKFLLEKVERVNVTSSVGNPQGLETLPCPLNGKEITIFDLINNTKEKMGKTSFLDYDPVSNNCQVFLMNVLDANGLLNAENKDWVKQDTEILFKNNKVLAKVSKKLTDIGASANVLLKGGNLENYEKNKISTNIIMTDFNYLLPHKAELHKNLLARDTYDMPEPLQSGMGIGKTFKKIGKRASRIVDKIEGGIDKANNIQDEVNKAIAQMKGVPDAAKAHLKNVGLDVAEILLKRGVPVTAGTIAGILATAATGGNPAAGIAASVATGYAAQLAANEIAKRENIEGSSGSGLGGGLYASSQGRGFDSDSDSECSCEKCEMCGGRLLVDRKFSVRDVYDAAKSVPKVYKENMKSLKEGKQEGSGMKPPPVPKVVTNGIVAPKMGGRGVKGSPEAKLFMAKLREMRKKK